MSPVTCHLSLVTVYAVGGHQPVKNFARTDHSEFLAGDSLLFRRIPLDPGREGLEGINGCLEGLDFSPLLPGIPPELNPIAGAVLSALKGKNHGQQDDRNRGPSQRRHSE